MHSRFDHSLTCLILLALALLAGCVTLGNGCIQGDCTNGSGVKSLPNGATYEGQFTNGTSVGSGKITFANKLVYVGETQDFKPHGTGTMEEPGRSSYIGTWKAGHMDGFGTFSLPVGKYVGGYKAGRLNGIGVKINADGSLNQRGVYANDQLVQELSAAEFERRFRADYGIDPPYYSGGESKAELRMAEIKFQLDRLGKTKPQTKKARQQFAAEAKRLADELRELQAGEAAKKKAYEMAALSSKGQATATAEETKRLQEERERLAAEKKALASEDTKKRIAEEKALLERQRKEVEALKHKGRPAPAATAAASPTRRTALVIGNGAYTHMNTLQNPINDARDMADALKELGFSVTLLVNADKRTMEEGIRAFGKELIEGGLGLFYYAGHGVQVQGENYLAPINVEAASETDLRYGCVNAGLVLGKMEEAKNDPNIIILDACRNNPFARSFTRGLDTGLAKMDAPSGSIIAYATSPGKTAADGTGQNGLYTKHLLKNIKTPGLSVDEIFKQVRIGVSDESKKKQIPWEASSLFGHFILKN